MADNTVTLVGNVTRDPLVRLVAAFSPRSPQHTTLKNETCSCHSPFCW